ncbi:MAG: hypothetical protein M5R36_00585 [Deltaproteobacteria bacterium]|nr:hypothetical protein [Deltaproteobacteria bacterium]
MPPARSRPHRAIAFFLGFFAVVLYARTLMGGFVYDDLYYVRDNPAIRHLSNIPYFFTDPDTGVNHPDQARMIYRPLATAFFAVENALFETRRPTLFHATSVVLFLSVFGLLYSLVTLLADRDETPAVFAATLVVVHPIAVESVAWISAQPTVLCAALMLAGLGAYLFGGTLPPERRGAFFFAAGGFFVAAMLVKEVALTAPLIVLAAHRYLKPAYEPRERVWFFAMLTMASLAVFSLRAGLTGRVAQIALYDESPWRHAVLAFGLIPRYLTGLFYPPSLRVFHDAPVWSIPSALVGVAFLGGLVAAAEALRARKPVAAFGLVFCLLTYLPSSNLLPHRDARPTASSSSPSSVSRSPARTSLGRFLKSNASRTRYP